MPLDGLSAEQKDAFYARLKEFQLNPSQVVERISGKTHPGRIVFSSDPAVSTIKPNLLTLTSLDEAKRLAGNADEEFENGNMKTHHEPLPEWPAALNGSDRSSLTPEQNQLVEKAHKAYLYGNSKEVQSFKTIIEKLNYPAKVAVFAVEDMCVDASNSPVTISSNAGIDIGVLTIGPGGQFLFEANANVTIQKLVRSDQPCKK